MRIDTHMHCYPDHLAQRTIGMLTATAHVSASTDGTFLGTIAQMDRCGTDIGVILSVSTKPKNQKHVNDFAKYMQDNSGGRLICFGSVHPDAEDMEEEMYRVKELGLYGVKLHPNYQGFCLDDTNAVKLYELAAKLDLPVAFHMGYDPVEPDYIRATPKLLSQIIFAMPDLTVIAAHMGGVNCSEEAAMYLSGKHCYIDTSMSTYMDRPELHREVLIHHDPKLILFGSDTPWSDGKSEWEYLKKLNLPEDWYEDIEYKNAKRLFGL